MKLSVNRARGWRGIRNSPNHRGIHLPRQGEILVRVPRAERVQPRSGRVTVLPVLVYRQIPRRAWPCSAEETTWFNERMCRAECPCDRGEKKAIESIETWNVSSSECSNIWMIYRLFILSFK